MSEIVQYACRLLARREYSVGELKRKLALKWPESEEIDPAVEQLVREGLISDRRFAAAFVRSRVAKLQGPRKIYAELKRRSINDADIDLVMEELGQSWTDLAAEWLGRQGPATADFDTRAKYYRRLVNRGFTHDQAMDALSGLGAKGDGV